MILYGVAVLLRDLDLQLLDSLVVELDDVPRSQADHMIVVGPVSQFEHRRTALEVVSRHEAGPFELRQHAIHGRETEFLPCGQQRLVDGLGAEMAIGTGLQNFQDLEPGRRHF